MDIVQKYNSFNTKLMVSLKQDICTSGDLIVENEHRWYKKFISF
jgi:hypothetical protein